MNAVVTTLHRRRQQSLENDHGLSGVRGASEAGQKDETVAIAAGEPRTVFRGLSDWTPRSELREEEQAEDGPGLAMLDKNLLLA
jgi:hypothetical protein